MSMQEIEELFEDLDADETEYMRYILGHEVHPTAQHSVGHQAGQQAVVVPETPLLQARELDAGYRARPHLQYLSDRLAAAVKRVEEGETVFMRVSMPPRMGKSTLASTHFPTWLLRMHPDWNLGLLSHSPSLAVSWGRAVRRVVEENTSLFQVEIAKDAGAAAEWETTAKGGVVSKSVGQSITGLGFKVLIIDDAVKDFADAHSETKRQSLWDWYTANAYTRLEFPALVLVIGTRWHEDDLIGRLASSEYNEDLDEWEVVEFSAIAEADDVLGRKPGEPLLSPLVDETPEEAISRWAKIKRAVGTYAWSALYQQRPSPAQGAIFNVDWWKYWTTVPALADKDDDGNPDPNGRIKLIDPDTDLVGARWLDSWDMAFKKTKDSDYVVGQRWCMHKATRYLMHQTRGRRTFTETKAEMKRWRDPDGPVPWSNKVHESLVEDKANGTAIIDSLQEEISGIIPINPTESKEARARAITPDVESGSVRLPLPAETGNEWVQDYISEHRDFPNGAHDDQVDSTSQALYRMRTPQKSGIANPGNVRRIGTRNIHAQSRRSVRRRSG